jgi:hypothetical protein
MDKPLSRISCGSGKDKKYVIVDLISSLFQQSTGESAEQTTSKSLPTADPSNAASHPNAVSQLPDSLPPILPQESIV